MKKNSKGLRYGPDRDVYQVVTKLLDDQQGAPRSLSVSSVYDAIKRSNSSLKRRPKRVLEDSIDRVLAVLQEEGVSDSDATGIESEKEHERSGASNVMNRSIVKSWGSDHGQLRSNPDTGSNTPLPQPVIDQSVNGIKKHQAQEEPSVSRPSKRPKISSRNVSSAPPTHISLSDIGGMDDVIEEFEDYLILPLKQPQRYLKQGLKIPRGILLHGPPGCGKTVLCEAVAAELGLPFLHISAPSIVSGMSGESEKQLRQHFEHAVQLAPAIMFIDEIDAITPKREGAQREMERRIVGQLLTCMDDLALEKTGGRPVIILAATNRPDALDPALRRAGRFDAEINIGVPNAAVREKILKAQTRNTAVGLDVDFSEIAKLTPGFVGADLESLIYRAGSISNARYKAALKELSNMEMDTEDNEGNLSAAVKSFRRLNKLLDDHPDGPLEAQTDTITHSDFLIALPHIQPSAKREGFATIPETTWSNVGALTAVRAQLQAAIVEPIRSPEKYERFNISVPAGVLLYGPPGCGKTLLAKAVANESKANFISVKGPELLNKYVGESERAVRQVFFRARSSVPCVIFFDELDALVPRRDDSLSEASSRVVNTLLTELDGISNRTGIYVIAATNRPDMIDAAMLRPGRLGKHLFVGLPTLEERVEILKTLLVKMPISSALPLEEAAKRCEGFSGADLSNLVYESAQHAVQRDAQAMQSQDLEFAVDTVKPSVGQKDMVRFEKLKGNLMSKG